MFLSYTSGCHSMCQFAERDYCTIFFQLTWMYRKPQTEGAFEYPSVSDLYACRMRLSHRNSLMTSLIEVVPAEVRACHTRLSDTCKGSYMRLPDPIAATVEKNGYSVTPPSWEHLVQNDPHTSNSCLMFFWPMSSEHKKVMGYEYEHHASILLSIPWF